MSYMNNFTKGLSLFLFSTIIIFYFAMNLMIPKWSDDMCYQYKFISIFEHTPKTSPMGTELNAPIESFYDAVSSNVIQYIRFNGRAVVHTFVQYFCMFDSKIPYSIVSCVLFGILIVILGKYITYNRQSNYSYLYPLLIFTFLASSRCMYNGIATGVNYVWALAFCVIYVKLLCKSEENRGYKYLLYLMAFLGGFSHEAISVAVSGALVFFLLKKRKERKNVSKVKLVSIYVFLTGSILLLIAPSNIYRFFGENSVNSPIQMRVAFFEYLRWSYLLIISAFLLKIKGKTKDFVLENKYILASLLTGSLFVLFVGANNARSVFFIDTISGVLFFRSLYFLFPERRISLLYPLLLLILVPIYSQLFQYQRESSQIIKTVATELEHSKDSHVILSVRNVKVPTYLDEHIYRLQPEKDYWPLVVYKWRYQKEAITFKYE